MTPVSETCIYNVVVYRAAPLLYQCRLLSVNPRARFLDSLPIQSLPTNTKSQAVVHHNLNKDRSQASPKRTGTLVLYLKGL